MKKYLILYRPFLIFLASFFLSYLVLTLLYQAYLLQFDDETVDGITKLVAKNTQSLLHLFQVDFQIQELAKASFIVLKYNQQAIARMIEGCNAVNVIILFIAFVVAFSGKIKTTLWFVLFGSVFIYILNIVRIALLCAALYWYPQQQALFHGIIFPLFIYGVVFILWVIWVNKCSRYAE